MTARQKAGFYGWTNLVLLFLSYSLLFGVIFYGFSVVFPAMIKAMKWARGDASIAQTIRVLVVGFSGPLVAILINRWSVRTTTLIGGLITVTGLLLPGTAADRLWLWTLL